MTQHRSWKDIQSSIEESVKLQQELEKRIGEYRMIAQSIMHKQGVKVTKGSRSFDPYLIHFGRDSFETNALPWFLFPYKIKVRGFNDVGVQGEVYERHVHVPINHLKLSVRKFASLVRREIQRQKAAVYTREVNTLVAQLQNQEELFKKLAYMEKIRSNVEPVHRMHLSENLKSTYRDNRKFIEAYVPGIEKW